MLFLLVRSASYVGLYSSTVAQAGTIPVHICYNSARCENIARKTQNYVSLANTILNFHVQVNATSCHSNFEIHRVMNEQLFNALKAIETLASGTMNVHGLPEGQGMDRRNIIPRQSRLWPKCSPYTFIVPSAKVTIT